MALTWKITFTIRDGKGQRGYTSLWYGDQSDNNFFDAYGPWEFASLAALELNEIIDGVIEAINVSFNVALPDGLRTVPETFSDIEEGLIVVYETDAGTFFKQRIPTVQEQYVPHQRRFDAFPEIPFVDWMLHPEDFLPGGGAILGPTDQRGVDLKRVRSYASAFKPSRRK